jgi:hypothetical protein
MILSLWASLAVLIIHPDGKTERINQRYEARYTHTGNGDYQFQDNEGNRGNLTRVSDDGDYVYRGRNNNSLIIPNPKKTKR